LYAKQSNECIRHEECRYYSSHLAGIAYEEALLMAGRGEIDHTGFVPSIDGVLTRR
jgi:hypothetical protein